MKELFEKVESELPKLILRDDWKAIHFTEYPPLLDRLWREYDDCLIFLHRIFPLSKNEVPLMHKHSRPSIFKILKGGYTMDWAYQVSDHNPPEVQRIIKHKEGTVYSMFDRNEWHSVYPVGHISWSFMLMGKRYHPPVVVHNNEPYKDFKQLSSADHNILKKEFQAFYPCVS